MSDSSRRGFLKATGAGVAAAGVAAAVVTTQSDASSATQATAALPASAKREMLIHVRDVNTGAISMMVEGHEVTVHDRDLAHRIAGVMHSTTV